MARIEIKNIGKIDARAKSDFKDFSHESGLNGWYRREVRAGRLSCFAVIIEGARVGSIALRRENQPHGLEMVIVAGGGSYHGQNLTPLVLEFLEGVAARSGLMSVRFHTKREGLILQGQQRGYFEIEDGEPDEMTMRKFI